MRALLILLVALLPAATAWGGSVRAGEHTVYYNALPTTRLTPDVARAAGVTRSASRALVNIAVRRHDGRDDAMGEPVAARVNVEVRNQVGQLQTLRMREVREADAIYYLGEARFSDLDVLDFQVEALVEGESTPIRTRFEQQFFVER